MRLPSAGHSYELQSPRPKRTQRGTLAGTEQGQNPATPHRPPSEETYRNFHHLPTKHALPWRIVTFTKHGFLLMWEGPLITAARKSVSHPYLI